MNSLFIEKFKVPEVAVNYLDLFFEPSEIEFVEKINKDVFTKEDVEKIIDEKDFLQKSYKRALISVKDEENGLYRLNNFYEKLNEFCITERDLYRSINEEDRQKIESWFFNSFFEALSDKTVPTDDRVYLLEEILEYIENEERTPYLNYCDCRSVRGDCGLPTKTCITYNTGINSRIDRGIGEKIDKETAKQIVINAEKEGLMHTANSNGICNCCGDCCYILRSLQRKNSQGVWPISKYIVDFDEEKCISCGKCVKRCHFGVFEKKDKKITIANKEKCIGCGICKSTCKANAITMKERD